MAQNPYVTNTNTKTDANSLHYPSSSYPPQNELFNFLSSLDLDSYYAHFTQAQVMDMKTLKRLTNDDLKEIGIPVGPRRTILDELELWNGNSQLNNNNNNNNNNNGIEVTNYRSPEYENGSLPKPLPNNVLDDINNKNNNNNNNDNNTSSNSEIIENTTRPWFHCCLGTIFSLPFPFLCFGIIYYFVGHTSYYKFDNQKRTFEFYKFRGMCCLCLDVEEASLKYSDIKCLRLRRSANLEIFGRTCGEIVLVTRDQQRHILTSGSHTMDKARQEIKRLSKFTGIPITKNGIGRTML